MMSSQQQHHQLQPPQRQKLPSTTILKYLVCLCAIAILHNVIVYRSSEFPTSYKERTTDFFSDKNGHYYYTDAPDVDEEMEIEIEMLLEHTNKKNEGKKKNKNKHKKDSSSSSSSSSSKINWLPKSSSSSSSLSSNTMKKNMISKNEDKEKGDVVRDEIRDEIDGNKNEGKKKKEKNKDKKKKKKKAEERDSESVNDDMVRSKSQDDGGLVDQEEKEEDVSKGEIEIEIESASKGKKKKKKKAEERESESVNDDMVKSKSEDVGGPVDQEEEDGSKGEIGFGNKEEDGGVEEKKKNKKRNKKKKKAEERESESENVDMVKSKSEDDGDLVDQEDGKGEIEIENEEEDGGVVEEKNEKEEEQGDDGESEIENENENEKEDGGVDKKDDKIDEDDDGKSEDEQIIVEEDKDEKDSSSLVSQTTNTNTNMNMNKTIDTNTKKKKNTIKIAEEDGGVEEEKKEESKVKDEDDGEEQKLEDKDENENENENDIDSSLSLQTMNTNKNNIVDNSNIITSNNNPSSTAAIVKETANSSLLETTLSSSSSLSHEDAYKKYKGIFDQTQPWKDPSVWTKINRSEYSKTVELAHQSTKSVLDDVYTQCEMYILPPLDNFNTNINMDWKMGRPQIKFRCLADGNKNNDVKFQDELCHTVNMCLVVLDETAWANSINNSNSTYGEGANNILNNDDDDNSNKSAILMMVDSIEYLSDTPVFKATLNKASYSYTSNRKFYIWIGNLNSAELNKRNYNDYEDNGMIFGAKCLPNEKEVHANTMHYYKPIAFLILFDMLSSSTTESSSSKSFIFMDADTDFTQIAFERIKASTSATATGLGPETYLDASSQASIMGTQNLKGQNVMNSGLMIVRETKVSKDISALWWYTRCGRKDQSSLWLTFFATFSAWTQPISPELDTTQKQFSYPGQIFYDYDAAKNKAFMFFGKQAPGIQYAWKNLVEQQQNKDDNTEYNLPRPTNIDLYNGSGRAYRVPLELPHIMILPQASFQFQHHHNTSIMVDLPRLKSEDGNSFTVHSKTLNSCYDGRCWPYVIE